MKIIVLGSYDEAKIKLPRAMYKSDLSSADDIIIGGRPKRILKNQSLSPYNRVEKSKKLKVKKGEIKKSPDSCPPRYGKDDILIRHIIFICHFCFKNKFTIIYFRFSSVHKF